jgi:hypothetical protein
MVVPDGVVNELHGPVSADTQFPPTDASAPPSARTVIGVVVEPASVPPELPEPPLLPAPAPLPPPVPLPSPVPPLLLAVSLPPPLKEPPLEPGP